MTTAALFAFLALQPAVDQAFENVRGAAVVLDIPTGRILAVHNRALAENHRAAPGSTIKPFVLAGLIQANRWAPKTALVCGRSLSIGARKLDCSHPPLPGALDASDAIAFSCNHYFASVAGRVGVAAVAEAVTAFGFSAARGVDPRLLALGDRGVETTPLELARAFARLARLRSDARYASVWKGLVDAVEAGTGQLAAVPGLSIAGKTGTTATHAWFAALAPAARPEVAVVVFTRQGRGGGTAAPIAGRILGAWASTDTAARTVNVQHRRVAVEEYVAGVLAGEASHVTEPEALAAYAVLARTFAFKNPGRHSAEGYDVCAGTHCQRYRPAGVTARLEQTAAVTEGEILWYQGRPADVFYHQHCGGTTEAAHDVWPAMRRPYLVSRPDSFCVARGRPSWRAEIEAREFSIAARSPSGRVTQVRLDGRLVAFDEFQSGTGSKVRSALFQVRGGGGRFQLEGYGAGHGVGLCHSGAIERARAGHGYRRILDFYFPGAKAGITAQGLGWSRRSGERIELWSVEPGRDESLLGAAAEALRAAEARFGARLESRPVLRVYPDVAVFRDATGEPGWVLASTVGRTIRLRREGARALFHEFLHMLCGERTRAALPDWFREGLVLYLENPSTSTASPSDASLRDAASEAGMRAAYRSAKGRVGALVARYGRDAVLGWLSSGLPSEVAANRFNQANTTSK
ncbi:MAG: SpoIID/LytB domain-containing protein [Bryobacteraceae bacterium]